MEAFNGSKEKRKQTALGINWENIKSKYILKHIFGNLDKKIQLEIIRYNKNIRDKLNINLNDYIEYPKIEIEIIPVENKNGLFFPCYETLKPYVHIYFNDDKKEVQRGYLNINDNVSKIKIIIDRQIKTFSNLFGGCDCIELVNFKKFERKNIINMAYMFINCRSLKEINLSNFKTDNVKDMSCMFSECYLLKELDISSFKMNNVYSMNKMFFLCNSLQRIIFPSTFGKNKLNNMSHMFFGCSSLKELNLTNFDTSNVNNMNYLFGGCSSLKELDLSNFNTNNVIEMCGMFFGCSSLDKLDISNFNTANVDNIIFMFGGCSDKLIKEVKEKNKIKSEAFDL